MRRQPEEYQKTREQRRAEAQQRREQRRREDRRLECLLFSVVVWLLAGFHCAAPYFSEGAHWIFFSLAVLLTVVMAVVDFRRRGFMERSWLCLMLDGIFAVFTLIIII